MEKFLEVGLSKFTNGELEGREVSSYKIEDNKISTEMVQDFIADISYVIEKVFGKVNTVMRYKLKNGFTGVESTSCVDEENYSFEIVCEILRKRLEDKIWFGLGFALAMAQN